MTFFKHCFFPILVTLSMCSVLTATEYLNQNLNWKAWASHCEGGMQKVSAGYKVSKAVSPDVNSSYETVWFFNEKAIPCTAGIPYRITMTLTDCDATIKPRLHVNFPTQKGRKPGSYTAEFVDGTAVVEFKAEKGDAVRANLILGNGDGSVVVKSVTIHKIIPPTGQSKQKRINLLGQGSGFEVGPRNYNAFAIANWWWGFNDLAGTR